MWMGRRKGWRIKVMEEVEKEDWFEENWSDPQPPWE